MVYKLPALTAYFLGMYARIIRLFRLQPLDLVMHATRYFSCSGNCRRSTLKTEHALLITTP